MRCVFDSAELGVPRERARRVSCQHPSALASSDSAVLMRDAIVVGLAGVQPYIPIRANGGLVRRVGAFSARLSRCREQGEVVTMVRNSSLIFIRIIPRILGNINRDAARIWLRADCCRKSFSGPF